jgi:hypothetical protein
MPAFFPECRWTFFLVTGITYSASLFPPLSRIVFSVNILERVNHFAHAPVRMAVFFGVLTFLLRLPFLFRYDLFFGSDHAISYLTALRILRGIHEFYFPGTDYHATMEAYFMALLLKIFGPSIPLAATVGLLEWSIAVGLGVFLLIRATTPFHGLVAGLVAAVSVPYTLIYVIVPFIGYPASFLITLLLLWEVYVILERGPSSFRFLLFGFTIGISLFIAKQCVPGIATALLCLLLFRTPAWNIRHLLHFITLGPAGIGFVTGYFPEIWYRFHHVNYRSFSSVAAPKLMVQNCWGSMKAMLAYFDAHPISRIPEDIYFYHSIPFKLTRPADVFDILFVFLAAAVLIYMLIRTWLSWRHNNPALFLLTALYFVNLAAVIISRESQGNIFNARRFLHTSAISFSLLTGLFLVECWERFRHWGRWLILGFGVLFISRCAYNQYALLCLPDGLRELRWVIQGMDEERLNCGLSYWGPNYIIVCLTNERIVFTNRNREWVPIPEYDERVKNSERIGLMGYKDEPIDAKMTFEGNSYQLDGDVRENELVWWAPYRNLAK